MKKNLLFILTAMLLLLSQKGYSQKYDKENVSRIIDSGHSFTKKQAKSSVPFKDEFANTKSQKASSTRLLSLAPPRSPQPNHAPVFLNITTFPWSEGFESGTFPPGGWSLIDNDGDGFNWLQAPFPDGDPMNPHSGTYSATSASWDRDAGALTPDNYLITPPLVLPQGAINLKFWVAAQDPDFPADHYEVMVSTTGTSIANFISIFEETLKSDTWVERTVSLNNYAGQTIYIAFVHNESPDVFMMKLDDVSVEVGANIDAEVVSINRPSSGELGAAEQVVVSLKNNGIASISNFTVKLVLGTTEIATETVTASVAAGATYEYTFTATLDLSAIQNYDIKVTVNLPGDGVASNNTIEKAVRNLGPGVDLFGSRLSTADPKGLFSFNSSNPVQATQVTTYADGTNYIVAGEYLGGNLYLYTGTNTSQGLVPANYVVLSTSDWTEVSKVAVSNMATDMAFDYSTGTMYGLSLTASGSTLYTINIQTGEMTEVTTLTSQCPAMAVNRTGDMYVITVAGILGTVNKTTGAITQIAETGLAPGTYYQSMTFDHNSGRLFLSYISADNNGLTEINPADGTYAITGDVLGVRSQITALYATFDSVLAETMTPADRAIDVAINAAVSAVFNSNITAGTLTDVTITPDPGSVVASITGNTVHIAHADFNYGTVYTVTIPSTAVDELSFDVTWSFTTMLDPTQCNVPTFLEATDINSYDVTLSWQENGPATLWDIKYGETGFNVDTEGTLVANVDNNTDYLLEGLNDRVSYDFYVRAANCTGDVKSDWAGPYTFVTPADCSVVITQMPWTEGFESTVFPEECWTLYTGNAESTNWQVNTSATYVKEGSRSVYHSDIVGMQDAWLITPKITVPTEGNYALKFWSYNHYSNYYIDGAKNSVLISSVSNDPTSDDFDEVWYAPSVTGSWVETVVSLSEYAGEDVYIAFRYEGDNAHRWYLDEVSIEVFDLVDAAITEIVEPVNGVNHTSTENVKVVVRNNGSQSMTGFTLNLKVNGSNIATETYAGTIESLSEAEYTFTATADLSADGDHEIEVTVNLTGDQVPENNVLTATISNTVCNPITTFPWTENFTDGLSECWITIDADGDEYNWFTAQLDGNVVAASESYAAPIPGLFEFPLTPDNYLITPQLQLDDIEYLLTYNVGASSSEYFAEKYAVMVSTTGTAPADFSEVLLTETLTTNSFKSMTLSLGAFSGQSIYIAFRHYDCTDQYALLLDDIHIQARVVAPEIGDMALSSNSGSDFSFTPVDGNGNIVPSNTRYRWDAPTATGIDGLEAGTNETSVYGTLTNTTNAPIDVVYVVTPFISYADGTPELTGEPFSVTVTVYPVPVIGNETASICNYGTFEIIPANGNGNIVPDNTTYSWLAPTASGIDGLVDGTDEASINGTLINTTTAPIDVVYTVIPTSTFGSGETTTGTPFTVTITVTTNTALGLQQRTIAQSVLYPNPVKCGGKVTIRSIVSMNENVMVEIMASNGTILNTFPVTGEEIIFTAPHKAGMYIINVYSDTQRESFKLSVE